MQKVALSPLFVEGWAGYVEEMMLAEGWLPGDAKVRVAAARATLLRAARLVAAVRLHALGAKLDDATKVFTDEAGLEDVPARREAERAAIDPMVLGDALGRIAIVKLRDDWRAAHAGAPLGAFHDALLAARHAVADLPAQGAPARRHGQPVCGDRSARDALVVEPLAQRFEPDQLRLEAGEAGVEAARIGHDEERARRRSVCGLAPAPGVARGRRSAGRS